MRQIVLDTETTGLDFKAGHRIIEIGGIEIVNRRLTGNTVHYYINPEREVEEEALSVHGIDNEFLQDKPLFVDIAKEFCEFIEGAEIIAHNAQFDIGFLDYELKKARLGLGKISKYCQVFDTLVLARKLHPGQRNSLDALRKRYNVDHINRNLHGALLDAEILAHVYLAMTGGQATLFGEETSHITSDEKSEKEFKKQVNKEYSLRVVRANNEELAEHKKFLEMLNAQE